MTPPAKIKRMETFLLTSGVYRSLIKSRRTTRDFSLYCLGGIYRYCHLSQSQTHIDIKHTFVHFETSILYSFTSELTVYLNARETVFAVTTILLCLVYIILSCI